MQRKLLGSINLTKLRHKMITYKSPKNGSNVTGIFIPVNEFDVNDLVKGEGDTWYLPIQVIVRDEEDRFGQHGFISQRVESEKYKKATKEQQEEYNKKPILGNIKEFKKAENEGKMGHDQPSEYFEESDDDLPF
jgi:hypothetical protein